MTGLTLDADDYHRIPTADRDALDVWLTELVGRPLNDGPMIWSVTLGEGHADVAQYVEPCFGPASDFDRLTETVRYPCPVPPPCWITRATPTPILPIEPGDYTHPDSHKDTP